MVFVISNPSRLVNEAKQINALFDAGMSVFHVRKPAYSEIELGFLLSEIDEKNHSKIAIHSYHELRTEFDITRLHFTEEQRKETSERDLLDLKEQGMILSTSIHSLVDYEQLSEHFDYAFCGPVFNSISKTDYRASLEDWSLLSKTKNVKRIALGGVDKTTIEKVLNNGFEGVAVLGSIWNQDSPVKEFQLLNSTCFTIVP